MREAGSPLRVWTGVSATDRTSTSRDDVSDAELIAVSESDTAAFGRLFDRHVDPIYRYLVRRVGTSLAEDLTAETFARGFAQRARFVPMQGSARPWLFGIATNLIHNARRAERRQLSAYRRAATVASASFDDFDQTDARVDAHRATPRLISGLIQLQPGDRDALLLFAWQELSYEEVGAALGIPAGTVASRINRARRRIRASLSAGDDSLGSGVR
jgi:RNA polymerase sigma factor (sigma-70 family)